MTFVVACAASFLVGSVVASQARLPPLSEVVTHSAAALKPNSEAQNLRLRLAFDEALSFERINRLHSMLSNCKELGETQRCTAFTESNEPVVYSCDDDGCAVACGELKGKP